MYAELATAIPSSAGPAAYTEKAFGRGAGFFAGFSYLVESLFCTPGICIAVGAYVHTLFPAVPAVVASVVTYLIFLWINCRGIEAGQTVGLIVTIIGVLGCALFAGVGLPHADFSLLGKMGDLGGVKGVFVAIPYAVWFFLAFEAGGMVDPRLVRADATKLDELRGILAQQEGSEILRPIEMKDIFIGHGAITNVVGAVRSLTPGKKVLMPTDMTGMLTASLTAFAR